MARITVKSNVLSKIPVKVLNLKRAKLVDDIISALVEYISITDHAEGHSNIYKAVKTGDCALAE